MSKFYRFDCPICQWNSDEAGDEADGNGPVLVPAGKYICPVCDDGGKEVVMVLTPEINVADAWAAGYD